MARKSMGKASKVLGGLGAAYALANAMRSQVRPQDVMDEDALKKRREGFAGISHDPRARQAEYEHRVREDDRMRRGFPALTPEQEAAHLREFPEISRSGAGLPIRTSDGFLTTQQLKKGGTVKGWGKARGARKAKVY